MPSGTSRVSGHVAGHPAELLVRFDGGMCWIEHDDFEELVLAVLSNPVGVEDLEVRIAPVGSLLGHALDGLAHRDLLDACLGRLALHVDLALAQPSSAYASPHYDDTLLRLVADSSSSVDAGGALDSLEHRLSSPARHAVASVPGGQGCLRGLPERADMLLDTHSQTSCGPPTKLSFISLPT